MGRCVASAAAAPEEDDEDEDEDEEERVERPVVNAGLMELGVLEESLVNSVLGYPIDAFQQRSLEVS